MGRRTVIKIGDKFGLLTVIGISSGGGNGKHSLVECSCECGNTNTVKSHTLKKINSCGCQRHNSNTWTRVGAINKPWTLPTGQAALNSLLYQYKRAAQKRNLSFELTLQTFETLVKSDCNYCGSPPNREYNPSRYNGAILCNGVDRKDSSFGYTVENSIPCCSICNFSKHTRTTEEFISHAHKISEHQRKSAT